MMLVSQLERALASCPELPELDENKPPRPDPERFVRLGKREDGWGTGQFCLPPEEVAVFRNGLSAARDAEFRDRQGLEPDAELSAVSAASHRPGVSWADGLVRMA